MSMFQEAVRGLLGAIFFISPYLNSALGLIITGYIVVRLLYYGPQYNRAERIGMGMVAGGILIATPALWIPNTPFDGWSFNIARIGITLYIITGGMRRDRHARRNALLNEQAELYLRERGKL
jgi:hypothetical protein